MKRRFYGRFLSVFVGISTLAITISALLSLAQQESSSDNSTPPELLVEQTAPPPLAIPSPTCPNCYTNACPECYDIFEEVPGTGITIARKIPNPAPLRPGEVRSDLDPETGLPIWYIGRQGYVGPTDEEPISPELPIPLIELERIQARHHPSIFRISGVTLFGIGAQGFAVLIEPKHFAENANRVPTEIEGVPVTVDIGGPFEALFHELTQYRPVPTGAGVGRIVTERGINEPKGGTSGPHIVRDDAQLGSGQCCIIYTLTSGHVLKHPEDPVPGGSPPTLQPIGGAAQASWGFFVRGFVQTRCDPNCQLSTAPLNDTNVNPDVAVIAHLLAPHKDPLGHISPSGSVEPIRRLQYGITNFVNGPSGVIQEGVAGSTELKWWGARSDAPKGTLEFKNVIAIIVDEEDPHPPVTAIEASNILV